ncbi:MAG: lmo0937 family membrane protein [bacterium]
MFWTIALILLVLWALGFFAFNISTPFIHLLIVIALIVVVVRLVTRRRV